jgi:3-hydroxyacyl-CoA dehydrogenase
MGKLGVKTDEGFYTYPNAEYFKKMKAVLI